MITFSDSSGLRHNSVVISQIVVYVLTCLSTATPNSFGHRTLDELSYGASATPVRSLSRETPTSTAISPRPPRPRWRGPRSQAPTAGGTLIKRATRARPEDHDHVAARTGSVSTPAGRASLAQPWLSRLPQLTRAATVAELQHC
jgi:hypothetical protein